MTNAERAKEWARLLVENPRLEVEDAYHRGWSAGHAHAVADMTTDEHEHECPHCHKTRTCNGIACMGKRDVPCWECRLTRP